MLLQSMLIQRSDCRRFIRGYSSVARLLSNLTRKGQPWNWNQECQQAFNELKNRFVLAPILVNNDPTHPKIIETDASNLAKGAVLSQVKPDNRYHLIAFYSQKFSDAELNYDIHDKEMVVIIEAFKEWSHFLQGTGHRVVVYTDHKSLQYFNSTKVLNPRQARWAEVLSEFDFLISYCPDVQNGKADALSRRSDPELEGRSAPQISIFKPGQLAPIQKSDQLLVQLLSPKGKVPTRGSTPAGGYDLYSTEDAIVAPHSRAIVSTDIAILVPTGTYGCIASRSGLAVKFSFDISAGVIDADYRGNIRILIVNHSNEVSKLKKEIEQHNLYQSVSKQQILLQQLYYQKQIEETKDSEVQV